MKSLYISLLCLAGMGLLTGTTQAVEEESLLGEFRLPIEQPMGQGRSAIWTMPLVATQYEPANPTPAMQAALQAQREARFLDALIVLDEADKSGSVGADTKAEMDLLRASFMLQGNQSRQAIKILAPLLDNNKHAADAHALTSMAYLELGKMQQALDAAQHAHDLEAGVLPHLAQSYALQGMGRLEEARKELHDFNSHAPQSAIALAREAELALTLDHVQAAKALVIHANQVDATHPYVIAVSGLTYLIDGNTQQAKTAFETSLKRDPKDAKALLGLGLAEIKLGNFQAGQEKLQAANESDPGNALILTYLGRSQQHLGQTEAARASWRTAQQADPKDPIPWLYQAQAELGANRPLDARESLQQAQARLANRSVYRGDRLLKEDEQLLQANLAEVQRQLGLEGMAFHTLSDSTGEQSSANLRNQADLLQGQRFGESARRSLLLQSMFNDRPGNLPTTLDIYGDGAGLTGAANPQRGVVSGLSAEQASYNNYDELFNKRTTLEADVTGGSKSNSGGQIRVGVGSDTLGLSYAQLQFKADGFASFDKLDNRAFQGTVQWRPTPSTQVFVSRQTFNSNWEYTFYPADPVSAGNSNIWDNSQINRWGLRKTLTEDGSSELRALLSTQQTDETANVYDLSVPPNFQYSYNDSSSAQSAELQYRRSGAYYSTQWGVQQTTVHLNFSTSAFTRNDQLLYAAWQQTLTPHLKLDMELSVGKMDNLNSIIPPGTTDNSTYLTPRWLPKLGLVYTPEPGMHLRLAAWKGMDISTTGDATLAPVSLAGFLLQRPTDINQTGMLVHSWALGADRQLSPAWMLDGETQQRRTDIPVIGLFVPNQQTLLNFQDDESKLALHWQPQGKPWTASLSYDYEHFQNDPNSGALDSVVNQNMRSEQLDMRWFANGQWTVNVKWSHNQVIGNKFLNDYTLPFPYQVLLPYQENFNQLDADMSWKFNRSGGIFTAGVRNATDKRYQYVEVDKLNPRFSTGRLLYTKLKLAW